MAWKKTGRSTARFGYLRRIQADLYLRLIKLNLAKYYRDYARKNRRSDFDAALDEFMQVRYRMEEEYGHTGSSEQKRQYALIWMDAIINIAKIHRRKYQVEVSEKATVPRIGFPQANPLIVWLTTA